MTNPLIIALDFPTEADALAFLAPFNNVPLTVKVGMELFYAAGLDFIRTLQDRGFGVFLDLKLHDIPNTVYSAMKVIGQLGIQYTTVHALGGQTMIEAASRGLADGAAHAGILAPDLLVITQLTSTDQTTMNRDLQIDGDLVQSVVHLAAMADQAGADGVVCSALEVPDLQARNLQLKYITPGIRLAASNDDQKRVVTPGRARQLGSTGLVIGRPITQADHPLAAYHRFQTEWEAAK
ncbi:orotidine-5'-phosphate decarboxylase [Levilactobacillus bambusae]|uniref:Orotidine 5'-phosphate decarboxylase n=1 Tax=Levilactobacillus bambusae TaxID=2024736 RepID=A0A2V1MX99_9LACO|nr:orotidine-5'-phosphate decarboxylase [Levilactobacillus bambusae]PWF99690.1 orotidine-5'-phosphate decarboxylase [Levilactobacillus bambusae]